MRGYVTTYRVAYCADCAHDRGLVNDRGEIRDRARVAQTCRLEKCGRCDATDSSRNYRASA